MHCRRRIPLPDGNSYTCNAALIAGFCPCCEPEKLRGDSSISTQQMIAMHAPRRVEREDAVA